MSASVEPRNSPSMLIATYHTMMIPQMMSASMDPRKSHTLLMAAYHTMMMPQMMSASMDPRKSHTLLIATYHTMMMPQMMSASVEPRKSQKNLWFLSPTHASSQGQWWSYLRTQRPQSSQCRLRRGCWRERQGCSYYIEAWTNSLPFYRWHFQIHLVEIECLYFDSDFNEICSEEFVD